MKIKIFTLFLVLAASVGSISAWDYEHVQIGDLYYNLDESQLTAEVTSQNSSNPFWSTAISTANIPSSVEYNAKTYSVTSIGEGAFGGCTGLTSITCKALIPPTLGDDVFYLVNKSIPLYVQKESIEKYAHAYQWADFYNILAIEETPLAIDEVNADPMHSQKILLNGNIYILTEEKVYTVTGQEVR